MAEPIIKVQNLSKRYRIGAKEKGYRTIRESIMDAIKAPFKNIMTLRKLTKFGNSSNNSNEKDVIWALKDIFFEVQEGEIVGIIGRNGAGKSTLLKILSRVTEPTAGCAEILGRVSSLLEVGTGFHPELTGRENVYLNGTILGMRKKEIDRKFDEIVDFSGVEKFIDTPVKRYSSGMQVRLAFAVAAHLEPDILIIDEVLAVGDASFQKKCLGKMGDVAKEGRTVLFVSHNMGAINRLCKRCVLLERGKIDIIGDTESVVSSYLSQGESAFGLVHVELGNKDVAVIEEVGIINSRGDFSASVEVNKDFYMWIEFTLKRKLEMAKIAVAVLSVEGTTVFVTTHLDAQQCEEYTLLPNSYHARVRVPGNFLNVGMYSLNVRIFGRLDGEMRTSHASAYQVLTFRVERTNMLMSDFSDHRRGVITPILDWVFE